MIAIGSDHGGYELKEHLKKYLDEQRLEYHDYGTYSCDSVDFPDYAELVCRSVIENKTDRGILICGTGIGMSIAANKIAGIRCALCSDIMSARLSKEHNNANVIALGGRVLGKEYAVEILNTWLKTDFLGGKYNKRNDMITNIESCYLGGK
ncbi:MAG: ribose 5-phosphate isomerase B [Clostridia bacterium]|nr:ribose 5-phosphate isomerase B [Clostridia bacterium]